MAKTLTAAALAEQTSDRSAPGDYIAIRVRLGDLGLAPENLRFDEPADKDIPRLADTLAAAGVLIPPIVRAVPDRPLEGATAGDADGDGARDSRAAILKKDELVAFVAEVAAERRWTPAALAWSAQIEDSAAAAA